MAWWITALLFIWTLFKDWLLLFAAPFMHPEMLWIIVPVLFNWAFTEFYQEKKGTSLGNAISNGVMLLWVGIDWARQTVQGISGAIDYAIVIPKMALAVLLVGYGLYIMIAGAKAKSIIRFVGRIRVVTYFILVLSPIFYGIVPVSWQFFVAVIVFFPVFYYFIELLDWIIPDPRTYAEDEALGGAGGKDDFGLNNNDLGAGFGGELGSNPGANTPNFGAGLGTDFGSNDFNNLGVSNDFQSQTKSRGKKR